MNVAAASGIVAGIAGYIAYSVAALCKRKKPEILHAAHTALHCIGVVGAFNLLYFIVFEVEGFLAGEGFKPPFSLPGEDAIFIVLGAVALIHVCVQGVWDEFSALLAS